MRIYQADIYCDECGQEIEDSLIKPTEELWDSDDYPKSFPDGEEADSPQHCAACLRPIETTLTPDGIKCVLAAIKTELQNELRWEIANCYKGTYYEGSPHIAIVADWVEEIRHYGLTEKAEALIEKFDEEYRKGKEVDDLVYAIKATAIKPIEGIPKQIVFMTKIQSEAEMAMTLMGFGSRDYYLDKGN